MSHVVLGLASGRVVTVHADPRAAGEIVVRGLPPGRDETAARRIAAALASTGLAVAPAADVVVWPPVVAGPSWGLDLAIALAVCGVPEPAGAVRVIAHGAVALDGRLLPDPRSGEPAWLGAAACGWRQARLLCIRPVLDLVEAWLRLGADPELQPWLETT